MERIMEMTEGSRYSIIGFDSSATQQLPLTTDAGAAAAWIDTLETEPTAYSQGSNMDRPLTTLLTALTETRRDDRSEEHTSELQSRGHLVCRLLLEKKKKIQHTTQNKQT